MPARSIPESLGPYRLLDVLGEGGMGIVYLGQQLEPFPRQVAIKVIKLGMDTEQVVARFEGERQALARMDHPGIARVIDAGSTDEGRPYFVMEYVDGVSITEFCDAERLDTEARLRLFVELCTAVQHAHQRGLLHRDIKPSNVLVTRQDGRPVPKVIDFGLARAMSREGDERSLFTQVGQVLGTPAYMSPEQMELSPLEVDSRTDIYSLGVVLFELLTGSQPFDAEALRSWMSMRAEERNRTPPPRPSTRLGEIGDDSTAMALLRDSDARALERTLRGELDWIVVKAIDPERERRYDSASEFAADIERYLNDEPVLAGPPSRVYRLRKFVARHRAAVVGAVLLALALVAGIATTTGQAVRAVRAEGEARELAEAEATQRRRAEVARDEADRARIDAELASDEADRARVEAESAREKAELARIDAEEARDEAETVLDLLTRTLRRADPRQDGREARIVDALAEAERLAQDVRAEHPGVAAEVLIAVGSTYRELGLLQDAERSLRKAVELRRAEGEGSSSALATALNGLAVVVRQQGLMDEAEELYRQCLEASQPFAEEQPDAYAKALLNLAGLLTTRGEQAEALALSQESLEVHERYFAADDEVMAIALSSHAQTLVAEGRTTEAQELLLEALERMRRAHPEPHPYVATTLSHLANCLLYVDDYVGAVPVLEEAVEIGRATWGPTHPSLGVLLQQLAESLLRLDQIEPGERAAREALEIALAVHTEHEGYTGAPKFLLAQVALAKGELETAEALALEAQRAYRLLVAPGHMALVNVESFLRRVRSELGH